MIPELPKCEITSVGQLVVLLENPKLRVDYLLFRGQREDWSLLPRFARLNLRRPGTVETELKMLDDLKLRADPFLEHTPKNDWDWLAIAQHHRMATRLLDWTINPLAALWFCVEQPAVNGAPGVHWVLNTPKLNQASLADDTSPFKVDSVHVVRPRHLASRITSQSGWFTLHPPGPDGQFKPLDQDPEFDPHLTKLTVPAASFDTIRYDLDRCGFNAASIYPGLEGLCKYVEWCHTYLEDEKDWRPRPSGEAGAGLERKPEHLVPPT